MTPTHSATRSLFIFITEAKPHYNRAILRANVIEIEFPTEEAAEDPIGGNHERTSEQRTGDGSYIAWVLYYKAAVDVSLSFAFVIEMIFTTYIQFIPESI